MLAGRRRYQTGSLAEDCWGAYLKTQKSAGCMAKLCTQNDTTEVTEGRMAEEISSTDGARCRGQDETFGIKSHQMMFTWVQNWMSYAVLLVSAAICQPGKKLSICA